MTIDANKPAPGNSMPSTAQPARTDDLLASGAEAHDGARGFEGKADPGALQTGMEGIAETTAQQEKEPTGSQQATSSQTLQDNVGQVRNKQGS